LKAGLEMNEFENSPNCERTSDLIAFVYNEMSERETRDFQLHLQQCRSCADEVVSFGDVRQSITIWRDEALAGFSLPVAPSRKSATSALRQFFDLSPLWLKGATAFAAVMFCVLAGLAVVQLGTRNQQVASSTVNPGAVYTEQDVNRIVKDALAKQENVKPTVESPQTVVAVKTPKPMRSQPSPSLNQFAKSRRPLSRAEREQLAGDLRLLSTRDGADLNLLGERINK
jgi:anti-sigma factor RsiW